MTLTVEDFFTTAQTHRFAGIAYDYEEELDNDHGRFEIRRYWMTDALGTLPDTRSWTGLRRIGMVERECCKAIREP